MTFTGRKIEPMYSRLRWGLDDVVQVSNMCKKNMVRLAAHDRTLESVNGELALPNTLLSSYNDSSKLLSVNRTTFCCRAIWVKCCQIETTTRRR